MALIIKIDPVFPEANVISKKGDAILLALEKVMEGTIATQLKNAMGKRVANWKHKPAIDSNFQSLPTRFTLLVKPTGPGLKQWKIVSGGARPHFIFPRNFQKGSLFIHGGRGGYTPKTSPGNKYGGPGSYRNNSYWAKVVSHPGVEPRNFEDNVAKEETPSIVMKIQAAIDSV